jgi:hypothetical protein
MNLLIDAYTKAWTRSFDYSSRSSRGDYWWFVLANFIVLFVLNLLGTFVGFIGVLANLYLIAQFVPHLPLGIRRLRDTSKHWAWVFIGLIPLVGTIWLLYLMAQPSVLA